MPHHIFFFFFFNDTATTEIYTLSLHDALPISGELLRPPGDILVLFLRDEHQPEVLFPGLDSPAERDPAPHERRRRGGREPRSEEHTSELQSPCNLVCRLLLEKKKKKYQNIIMHPKITLLLLQRLSRTPHITPPLRCSRLC